MKRHLSITLFLLTVFCVAPVFTQTTSYGEEKLKTEFIKLKNVPVCENKESPDCYTGKVSFKPLLNLIKSSLTRSGSIEIDRRSKTIIVTDITSNIESLKNIVAAYDYSEIYKSKEEEQEEKESYTGFAFNP